MSGWRAKHLVFSNAISDIAVVSRGEAALVDAVTNVANLLLGRFDFLFSQPINSLLCRVLMRCKVCVSCQDTNLPGRGQPIDQNSDYSPENGTNVTFIYNSSILLTIMY